MEPGFWDPGGGLRARENRDWRAEDTALALSLKILEYKMFVICRLN